MKKHTTKRENYMLGVLGQKIIENMFPLTTPGKRSFDLRILTPENQKTGHRVEVKARRPRRGGTFSINFTRHERTHSDTTAVLLLADDFEILRFYWIPTWRLPRDKGFLYFGKKANPKYEQFRLV